MVTVMFLSCNSSAIALLKDEILEKVASNAYLLDEPQERNFIKWPILGVWVWPNAVTFNEYNHEVAYLKD